MLLSRQLSCDVNDDYDKDDNHSAGITMTIIDTNNVQVTGNNDNWLMII